MTWRPLPPPGAPDEGRPPRPLAESLDVVSRRMGAAPAAALARVFERWEELVGAAVAAHSRPLSLVRGTLTVAVDQPAWAASLGWLEADLLGRFGDVLGAGVVTSLVVRVRPK
ncbi:MAG: DciA family protein [Acidimicrobiales bacterium]